MSYRSPAQRRAIAIAYAKKRAGGKGVGGKGAYYKRGAVRSPGSTARAPRVRGRGAYKKDYGTRLGSVVGEGIQELLTQINPLASIKSLVGFGDYAPHGFNVKENVLLSMGNDPPEVRNSLDGRFIIRHREYLTDIVTAADSTFNNTAFRIQPGISDTFPWLAQVAGAFEQYKMRGMIFEFKSTSADALNSTNTALGTVIMATEYDVSKPEFTTKQQMENHQFASSAKQSCSMLHPIECARGTSPLETLCIRTSDTEEDQRFCDFGNFQIATVGQQGASVNIGELWVTYELELMKPRLDPDGGSDNNIKSSWFENSTGVTSSNMWGTLDDLSGSSLNDVGCTLAYQDTEDSTHYSVIEFPLGDTNTYFVYYQAISSAPMAVGFDVPSIQTFGGLAGVTVGPTIGPLSGVDELNVPSPDAVTDRMSFMCFVKCAGDTIETTPGLALSGLNLDSIEHMFLFVTKVKPGMANSTVGPLSTISANGFSNWQKQMYLEYVKNRDSDKEVVATGKVEVKPQPEKKKK